MDIRVFVIAIFMGISTPWAVFAQGGSVFYRQSYQGDSGIGFKGGVNYSFPTVTAAVVSSSLATSFLGGVQPRYGYYIGGFMYKDLAPDQLTFRLDATLQMKGIGSGYQGKTVLRARYYYVGLSPLIGVHLHKNLTVYMGMEANVLLAKQNPWGKTYPFEIGTTLHVAYTLGAFSVEAGYFRGFTKLDRFELYNQPGGPAINDFYNQNIQLGLLYNWGK